MNKMLSKRSNVFSQMRSFAALNQNSINLDSTKPSDVHESTPVAVGALMAAMANSPKSSNESQLCDEVDEYFRLKFRKISFEDAKQIMLLLS